MIGKPKKSSQSLKDIGVAGEIQYSALKNLSLLEAQQE